MAGNPEVTKGSKIVKNLVQFGLVLLVLLLGVAGMKGLINSRKAPEKQEVPVMAPLVEARQANRKSRRMVVQGYGTVAPRREVSIVPQVPGRVVEVSENLINGGFFAAGELLIRIEKEDYKLAVESAAAQVARAQVVLDQQEAEAKVAREEWEQLNPGQQPTSELVFREPQIRQARAELAAAKASLARAKLDLSRTEIRMDFAGRVAMENVDKGQYLMAGQSIAQVYGTEVAEIVVPLEDRELEWFSIPDQNGGTSTPARVLAEFAGEMHEWSGQVVRTEGRIDPASRVVPVVVEVQKPFANTGGKVNLMPGMFVEVQIQGREVKDVVEVPRFAVHNGNEVWVIENDKLYIRTIEVIRRDRERVYIGGGIDPDAIVVVSPLDTVTDGMDIRFEMVEGEDTEYAETGGGQR